VQVIKIFETVFVVHCVSRCDAVVGGAGVRWHKLKRDEQIGRLMPWLLMAFALESEGCLMVHASLDLDLFVRSRLRDSFPVETNHLLFIAYSFHAPAVEFLKCCLQRNNNGGHGRQLWLIVAGKGGTEQAAFVFHRVAVTEIYQVEERIVFQKVIIKYFVAVLLVNVTSMAKPGIRILNTLLQNIRAVCIVDEFPLL